MDNILVTTDFEIKKLDVNNSDKIIHLGDYSKKFDENFGKKKVFFHIKKINRKKECLKITRKVFDALRFYQNNFYKLNISKKSYSILLIPFLNNFIEIFYQKYHEIDEKIKSNRNIKLQILNYKDFIYFKNFAEFISFTQKDLFNFQISSEVINFNKYSNNKKIVNNKLLKRFFFRLKKISKKVNKKTIYFNDIKFKKNIEDSIYFYKVDFRHADFLYKFIKIKKPLKKKIDKNKFSNFNLESLEQDKSIRAKVLKKINPRSKIDKFISHMVLKYLPTIYFESVRKNFINLNKQVNIVPKIITSNAHGWWTDDAFKYYSSFCIFNKSKYVDIQHNGSYFVIKKNSHFELSKYFSDFFLGWGDACKLKKRNIKLPALYSIHKEKKLEKKNIHNHKTKILFMGASIKRFFGGYCQSYMDGGNSFLYYLNQLKFFNHLTKDTIKKLKLRLRHNQNDTRGYVQFLKKKFEKLEFEDIKISAFKRLKKKDVSIVIVDHCSTPWLEVLHSNKPVIIFWDKNENLISKRYNPIFNSLKQKKIYFDCPIAAAKRLEELLKLKNNDWWYKDNKLQNLRKKILNLFFYTNPNPIKLWNNEISKIFYANK